MAALNFPNSPSVNDIHTENGVSFKWNGTIWKRVGTVDAGDGSWWAQTSTGINTTTSVGIGTTNPSEKLHVFGKVGGSNPSAGTKWDIARFVSHNYSPGNSGGLTIGAYWNNSVAGGRKAYIQSSQNIDSGSTSRALLLNPDGGAVGIGTDDPGQLLDITGNATSSPYPGISLENLNSGLTLLDCIAHRTGADQTIGSLRGYWGTTGIAGNKNQVASISFKSGDDTTNKDEGYIIFLTSDAGGSLAERVRIARDGHVAIGGYGDPGSIVDVRENKDGAETQIRLYNTDNGDTTTQTAAFYMSPDSRGTAATGFRAIKENPDFSTNAGRDIALSLNVTQNNSQLEALRILSDGKVGIGITVPLSELHIESSTGGEIVLSDSDSVRKNGIKCVSSDNLLIYTDANAEGGSSHIRFEVDGSEKLRIKDTGGITFNGDTSADNALNDFETGTWTATSREGTLSNSQTCKYTKIGNMVWVSGAVNAFSERGSTVDVGITNLPFTVSEIAMGGGAFYRVANTDDAHVGTVVNTSERIQFLVSSQGGSESWYYIDYNDLNNSNSQIKFSVWYRTTQ